MSKKRSADEIIRERVDAIQHQKMAVARERWESDAMTVVRSVIREPAAQKTLTHDEIRSIVDLLIPDDFKQAPPPFSRSSFQDISYSDPVYGSIPLRPEVAYLVTLPQLLRLHRIRQLPFCEVSFSGASHSRFEHSVGTSHVASLFADHFRLEPKLSLALVIAALLHDLAHGPFGHSLEPVKDSLLTFRSGSERGGRKLDKSALDLYLRPAAPLTRALENVGGAELRLLVQELLMSGQADAFVRRHPREGFLLDLLDSDADCDRIDYLARDTYHLNPGFRKEVPLRSLVSGSGHDVVPGIEGTQLVYNGSLEQDLVRLLLYRAELYRQVYQSPRKLSADTMVSHAVFFFLDEHSLVASDVAEEICTLTDEALTNLIRICGPSSARRLIERATYGSVYQSAMQFDATSPGDPHYTALLGKLLDFSFRQRVTVERNFSDSLSLGTRRLAEAAGLPPVLFSIPASLPRPSEAMRAALEGEERGRRHEVLLNVGGRIMTLREQRGIEGYDVTWQIPRIFHLLVLPELAGQAGEIRSTFDTFVQTFD